MKIKGQEVEVLPRAFAIGWLSIIIPALKRWANLCCAYGAGAGQVVPPGS